SGGGGAGRAEKRRAPGGRGPPPLVWLPAPGRVREAAAEEDTHATRVSAAVAGAGVAAAAPADQGVGSVDLRARVSVEVIQIPGGAAVADGTKTDAAAPSHIPAAAEAGPDAAGAPFRKSGGLVGAARGRDRLQREPQDHGQLSE